MSSIIVSSFILFACLSSVQNADYFGSLERLSEFVLRLFLEKGFILCSKCCGKDLGLLPQKCGSPDLGKWVRSILSGWGGS